MVEMANGSEEGEREPNLCLPSGLMFEGFSRGRASFLSFGPDGVYISFVHVYQTAFFHFYSMEGLKSESVLDGGSNQMGISASSSSYVSVSSSSPPCSSCNADKFRQAFPLLPQRRQPRTLHISPT
jgi:hypothetical protein